MQARVTVTQVCLLLLLLAVPALAANEFDITSLVSRTCNIQTTLEFQFSPYTILTSASSPVRMKRFRSMGLLRHFSF